NAIINADWLPSDEVQAPAAYLLNPGTKKRPPARLLVAGQPTSECLGRLTPVRQRTGVRRQRRARMDRDCRCQWSNSANPKLNISGGPISSTTLFLPHRRHT